MEEIRKGLAVSNKYFQCIEQAAVLRPRRSCSATQHLPPAVYETLSRCTALAAARRDDADGIGGKRFGQVQTIDPLAKNRNLQYGPWQ